MVLALLLPILNMMTAYFGTNGKKYFMKYSSYLFHSSSTDLPPLTTHDLHATIHETTQSAGGMCSWTYADWKLLP
eukprot:12326531-Karenia_brevis.AAC.1